MTGVLFTFVRLEFTSSIGPAPGRYPVAAIDPDEGDGDDALVVSLVGAPPPPERFLRRARRAGAADREAREVSLLRVSWVHTSQPLADAVAARRNLADLRPEAQREALVEYVLGIVNRGVRAYAAAALDPFAIEVSRFDPRAVVIGFGTGAQIDAGEWTEAFTVPAPAGASGGTEARVRLDLAVSEALAGGAEPLDGELHLLRALLDAEQARPEPAARELDAAVAMLGAQRDRLPDDPEDVLAPSLERAQEVAVTHAVAAAEVAEAARGLLDAIAQVRGAAAARRDAPAGGWS